MLIFLLLFHLSHLLFRLRDLHVTMRISLFRRKFGQHNEEEKIQRIRVGGKRFRRITPTENRDEIGHRSTKLRVISVSS